MRDARPDRLRDMAQFVVTFRMAPADYWQLTVAERNAIMREHNRRANKRG